VLPALGYKGPDDKTIKQLKNKLVLANTSQWISGHSAMKIPTPEVMKHVYKRWVMGGKDGIHKFGRYKLG